MKTAGTLRDLVSGGELIVAPGGYAALIARLAQYCGFQVIYMTGFGTAASHGYPDERFLGMSEMAENVRRISQAVDVPLIADADADADTGYGNFMSVYRTVREYKRAGAAGRLESE
jgi:2-methylisocitrate lyase-like PEP mutase family enzyme